MYNMSEKNSKLPALHQRKLTEPSEGFAKSPGSFWFGTEPTLPPQHMDAKLHEGLIQRGRRNQLVHGQVQTLKFFDNGIVAIRSVLLPSGSH